MAEKGTTVNVEVPPDAMADLKAFCKSKGRIQRDVLAQVIKWFISQPATVRRVVLEDVDEEMTLAYADMLERMATSLRQFAAVGPDRFTRLLELSDEQLERAVGVVSPEQPDTESSPTSKKKDEEADAGKTAESQGQSDEQPARRRRRA